METPAKLWCAAEGALLVIEGQLLFSSRALFPGKPSEPTGQSCSWKRLELGWNFLSAPGPVAVGENLSEHTDRIWAMGIALLLISCVPWA